VIATEHEAGCRYGGFTCGWWLRVDGCSDYHPETHIVRGDRCPCGNEFPGFGDGHAVCDADDRPLPLELQVGLPTPLVLELGLER
jgi:hypothetical protein